MESQRQWRLPISCEALEAADAAVGSGLGGPFLEVMTAADSGAGAETGDPFQQLGTPGPFSRTLLARVAGPHGGTIREIALAVQSDEYPTAERSGLSNVDVEAGWDRRWRLWNLAAALHAAPAVVDVLPSAGDAAPRLPPTLYCTARKAFFVPVCPSCHGALQTCRDDALLARHGMPGFGQSLARVLYCSRCAERAGEVEFYSLLPVPRELRERAPVFEQRDLYRRFGAVARAGGPLPCSGCANVPSCYPEADREGGEAVRLIAPLWFYDCRCLPTERLADTYGDFAAVLGGSPLTEDAAPGQASDFEGRYGRRRYLFEADPRGKLPLEIFRLKLMLFAQLATAVSRLHRATRWPHLGLSPLSALVECGSAAPDVPRLYNFRTRLIGIGDLLPRGEALPVAGAELLVPLFDPPLDRDSTFAGSLSHERPTRHDGMLAVRSVSELADGRASLSAELTCESLDPGGIGQKDLLTVVLSGRAVRLSVEFAAYAQPSSGQPIVLASLPIAVDADGLNLLRSLAGAAPVRTTFVVHRCLHVPADLQSLGFILFATLAANSEQGAGAVTTAARQASEALVRFVREDPRADAESIEERALAELRRLEGQGVLARRHVFSVPSQHPDPRGSIADGFWFGALLLGLRAIAQLPGFGLCRTHDDFDIEHPEGPVDRLRAELAVLTEKIDAELLGRHGMRTVFAQALLRVQHEATAAAVRERAQGGARR